MLVLTYQASRKLSPVTIDNAFDTSHIKDTLDRNALAQETISVERLFKVKQQMEIAEARNLQPHFVRSFFAKGFEGLNGAMYSRESGRFEITHVPALIACWVLILSTMLRLTAASLPDPLDVWRQRNPDVDLFNLLEVRFGDGYWVATSSARFGLETRSVILGSSDGTNWVKNSQAPRYSEFRSLEFGGGRWIAISFDGVGSVVTSTNGHAWSPIPNLQLRQVSYGNEQWVGVGSDGRSFLRSADGITWKAVSSDPAIPDYGNFTLTFGNGQWLALGSRTSNGGNTVEQVLVSSRDGENWAAHLLPDEVRRWDRINVTIEPASLDYGNGSWLLKSASCSSDTCTVDFWKSSDGQSWEKLDVQGVDEPIATIAGFAPSPEGGLWFGYGYDRNSDLEITGVRICISADLVGWRCAPYRYVWKGTMSQKPLWVAGRWVRSNYRSGGVITSTNGLDWTSADARMPNGDIAFGRQKWLGVELFDPQTSRILASADARQWSVVKTFPAGETLTGLAFRDGLWVINGMFQREPFESSTNYFILTSTDGESWAPAAVPPGPVGGYMRRVRHTEMGWIAFVTAWETQTQIFRYWLLRSPDGRTWNWQQIPPAGDSNLNSMTGITYGNGRWLAIARSSTNGRIFQSDDLVSWQLLSATPGVISQLEFASGVWFGISGPSFYDCCGANFSIVTSPNGMNWKQRYTWFSLDGNGLVTLADGRLTALLSMGSVLQSDPLLSLELNRTGDLVVRRASGIPVVIESSDNLREWQMRETLPLGSPVQSVTNLHSGSSSGRFYRARTP